MKKLLSLQNIKVHPTTQTPYMNPQCQPLNSHPQTLTINPEPLPPTPKALTLNFIQHIIKSSTLKLQSAN